MKVAHLTSVHPQNDNRIFYKECVSLSNAGHNVALIVAGADDMILNGVTIIGYPKSDNGRVVRMFKTSFLDMFKQCRKFDADVYHFYDPELIFIGLLLRILGKKVIYDIHENNAASILSKPYIKSISIRRILSRIFDIFEQISSKFFTAIVTARPDISQKFIHENIITLRNFPILSNLLELDKVKICKVKSSIIYVGGMSKIRGINELLDAFESLDEYELWLLGPITEEPLRRRIGLGCKNVKYFGVVEASQIFSYIQEADAGIVTFLPAPNHLTTLATKPFEYMACGKPMIMSNFKYWQDVFGSSSLYVNPCNPGDIRRKILELLENRKLLSDMSSLNSQLSLDKYNWHMEERKLLDLYKGLE